MTNISKGKRSSAKLKSMGDHDAFLCRITKSLYYSRLPMTDRLSLPVTEFAAELFTEVKGGLTLERLDVEEAGRISRNACVSPCSLVLALLYLERLKDCNPEYLHRVAPSELFLVSLANFTESSKKENGKKKSQNSSKTSFHKALAIKDVRATLFQLKKVLMVASKFLNDDGEEDEVFNTEWATSGDLTIGQINRLEKDFLGAIDWAIFVRDNDFWERLRKLEKDIAYKEGRKRGWFSYTELSCLMDNVPLAALIHAFVSISSICLATYAAGVATLLGSVLVASQLPGTSLTPRQTIQPSDHVVTNFTDSGLTTRDSPLTDDAETITDNAQISSEFFSRDFDISSYNDTCANCLLARTKKRNLTEEYPSWEWWLSSMMNWLPEYSKINYNKNSNDDNNNNNMEERSRNGVIEKFVENEKLQRNGAFITNSQLFSDDSYIREAENLVMEINWKETLSSNFDIPNNDWRYYATKISLGHRH